MVNISDDLFGFSESKGINSKSKGDTNERKLTKVLGTWVGAEFVRVPRSGGLRWQNRMNVCGDLICTDPKINFPFSIETKHYRKITYSLVLRKNSLIFTFWKQALNDAIVEGKLPMLFLKGNYMRDWILVMDLKDFSTNKIEPLFKGEYETNKFIVGWYFKEITKIPYTKFLKLCSTRN